MEPNGQVRVFRARPSQLMARPLNSPIAAYLLHCSAISCLGTSPTPEATTPGHARRGLRRPRNLHRAQKRKVERGASVR